MNPIEYKVIRLSGPERDLAAQLNAQGAGAWKLGGLTFDAARDEYVCILWRERG